MELFVPPNIADAGEFTVDPVPETNPAIPETLF